MPAVALGVLLQPAIDELGSLLGKPVLLNQPGWPPAGAGPKTSPPPPCGQWCERAFAEQPLFWRPVTDQPLSLGVVGADLLRTAISVAWQVGHLCPTAAAKSSWPFWAESLRHRAIRPTD